MSKKSNAFVDGAWFGDSAAADFAANVGGLSHQCREFVFLSMQFAIRLNGHLCGCN